LWGDVLLLVLFLRGDALASLPLLSASGEGVLPLELEVVEEDRRCLVRGADSEELVLERSSSSCFEVAASLFGDTILPQSNLTPDLCYPIVDFHLLNARKKKIIIIMIK